MNTKNTNEETRRWAEQPNHHIIRVTDQDYPPLLREIRRPPPMLFVEGDVTALHLPQLAIVGSRNPTPSGAEWAHEFAQQLCMAGLTITSGLALGVDAASHQGALSVSPSAQEGTAGRTVAVLGTGVDSIYPRRHQRLATQIIEQGGALVSELPLGTPARAAHFPQRNRIISGLSMGVLVIEAALKSGSLITAKYALEQNREIFALPGSLHNPLTRGCHALISQGAKLVETTEDIIEELHSLFGYLGNTLPASVQSDKEAPAAKNRLNSNKLRLLKVMEREVCTVDQLVTRSGLTPSQVSSILLRLELDGHVKKTPGGYCKVKLKTATPI